MDWSRRTYKTTCRFFKDSSTTADILWYPVPDSAPQLPYPTQIQNLNLSKYPWLSRVGEVYGAKRPFTLASEITGARGDPVCGSRSDFTDGAHFDPLLPAQQYQANGLPLCCKLPLEVRMLPHVRLILTNNFECPRAVPITLGQTVSGINADSTSQQWYTLDVSAGNYRLAFDPAELGPFPLPSISPFYGTDCDNLIGPAVTGETPGCFGFNVPINSRLWVVVFEQSSPSAFPWWFRVETGSCPP